MKRELANHQSCFEIYLVKQYYVGENIQLHNCATSFPGLSFFEGMKFLIKQFKLKNILTTRWLILSTKGLSYQITLVFNYLLLFIFNFNHNMFPGTDNETIYMMRCAIWYQTLKNGVRMVGQNSVLTS